MSRHHSVLVDLAIRRVERSFAFVDICGFTDFSDTDGDEAAVAELALLRSLVRRIAPQFGVRTDKWLGDGVLLIGVVAPDLVSAVVTLNTSFQARSRLSLRGGMASGSVVLFEGDDYVGRPVNLAARLCEAAPPGCIWAWADGLVLPADVTARPAATLYVKGFADPVEAVEILALPTSA